MFDYKLPVKHKKGTYNGRNGGALEEESQRVRNTLHLASAFFQLASKVDVFPGSDCRVAYEAAMKYGGKVLLGDRPADITIRRTWLKMPLWHKAKLICALILRGISLPSSEHHKEEASSSHSLCSSISFLQLNMNETNNIDVTSSFYQEMSVEFPTMLETLVNERDQYMSSMLLSVASQHNSVVAVVGKGHLEGIKKHWQQPVAIRELLLIPSAKSIISARTMLSIIGVAATVMGCQAAQMGKKLRLDGVVESQSTIQTFIYLEVLCGYRLWGPHCPQRLSSAEMVVYGRQQSQENEEGDCTTRETAKYRWKIEFLSMDSSEVVPQHERRGEPSTLSEALIYPDDIFLEGSNQVERYRARLVVKGYAQKEGIDFNEIFSPVNTNLFTALKQAPRCWYKRFDSFIIGLGYNRLHADPCAYFKRFGNNDFVILLLYVDDMLVAGPNKDRISKLKAQLAREFEMKDLGPANKILGMQIHRDRVSRKIWLSQKSYVKKILQRFNMQDCKPISTPFATNIKLSSKMSPSSEKERMEMSRVPYASAVGSLMFAMICTRPDIAHAVGVVSRYMAEPGKKHWEAVKRILRYIKGTSDVALCYGESGLTVKGYVDSDYAGDLDGSKSTTGYVFTLSGGTVSWVSKLQSVVAMSTTEAEYVAAAQASKEALWLKMLLEENSVYEQ
ncbi:retrovirus-related pol polyprotein from transposon TNT 1-94 [Tanacetum coccineum]